ncbi:MAG: hypothetical protein JNJ53_03635 [Rhizobiales bacterium]|nr:hypothetical protein [Hyphomicrobiales bacterium]
MMQRRFAVGQQVRLIQKFSRGEIDHYVIEQAMPYDGIAYEYRIKSESEKFLRVAKEHELDEEAVPFAPR